MQAIHVSEDPMLVGVSAITFKRWLLSGKVQEPSRNRNNWRVFSESDIALLREYAENGIDEQSTSGAAGSIPAPQLASFFSGIGGIDLGFQNAGFEVAFQCEVDQFRTYILQQHWPDVCRWPDIKELDLGRIPNVNAWVGGFHINNLRRS